MVMTNNGQYLAKAAEGRAYSLADAWMLFHDLSFFRSQPAGLEQDALRHSYFANVMNHARSPQSHAQILRKSECTCELDRILRQARTVTLRIGILGLDAEGQAEEDCFSALQFVGELLQAQKGANAGAQLLSVTLIFQKIGSASLNSFNAVVGASELCNEYDRH